MNYLAHLHLGSRSDDFLVGSLLGDFVRGDPTGRFPGEVEAGIRLHRRIDVLTDSHPAFRRARSAIDPSRRRFGGIIVDLGWDHVLACQWGRWHPGEPLERFVRRVYARLEEASGHAWFPGKLAEVAPRMRREDWLGSYATLEGMRRTFERVSRRSPRLEPIADGIHDLRGQPGVFDETLSAILPDLEAVAGGWPEPPAGNP